MFKINFAILLSGNAVHFSVQSNTASES